MNTTIEVNEDGNIQEPEGGWSEGHVRLMIAGQDIVRQLAEDYFWGRFEADKEWDYSEEGFGFDGFQYTPTIDAITFDAENVSVRASARACGRGCCGSDIHIYIFPLSYLWMNQAEILDDMTQMADDKVAAKKEQDRLAEIQRKQEAEDRERKEFLRLQTKFKGSVPPNGPVANVVGGARPLRA